MTRTGVVWRATARAAVLCLVVTLSVHGWGGAPAAAQQAEPCPVAEVGPAPFADRDAVPAAHQFAVDCAFWHEIVAGFDDDHYRPRPQVRRDQMASFVARALDAAGVELPQPQAGRFTDLDPASPHNGNIRRLAGAGIVQGGPGGRPADAYGPALGVRRDQMASYLLRAAEFAGNDDLTEQRQRFTDVPAGNTHFANVNGAHEIGVARGFADGAYRPHAGVRRDQLSGFVIRLLERMSGADPTTAWYPVDMSENESVRTGARYDSPAEALDALVTHLDAVPGAQVSHRITDWSDSHGAIQIRDVPDDALSGEDIVVSFLQDGDGWHADPQARARAHCRRGVSDADSALCV